MDARNFRGRPRSTGYVAYGKAIDFESVFQIGASTQQCRAGQVGSIIDVSMQRPANTASPEKVTASG
jgi:hypothetical protein